MRLHLKKKQLYPAAMINQNYYQRHEVYCFVRRRENHWRSAHFNRIT